MDDFVLKGDLCWSAGPGRLVCREGGFAVCEKGVCRGVFDSLPERWRKLPVRDYGGRLVTPGLVDLHTHASQFSLRAMGMDCELLEWLDRYAFPEEAKFADPSYARRAYGDFVAELRAGATTRAVIFATVHTDATLLLMEKLERSGLRAFVGKVSMDRNCPAALCERDGAAAAAEWLSRCAAFQKVRPILTPRFLPSCSDSLLYDLAELQRRTGAPVQSHLSENPGEVALVAQLCPDSSSYADAYLRRGLFGGEARTVMAHCVYSTAAERELIRSRGVFVAHCPQSNADIASGIAPVRRFLSEGLSVGLGTDVAGGFSASLWRAMADAIAVSKLRWRLTGDGDAPLTAAEAFYLATAGGGRFFGNVGTFEPGAEFDAVVFDDSALAAPFPLSLPQRLERMIYLGDEKARLVGKYVAGEQLF